MKRLFLIPMLLLAACTQPEESADNQTTTPETQDKMVAEMGTVVGEDPGDGPFVDVEQIVAAPETYTDAPVRVAGIASEVCQNAGCWLKFQNEDGVDFRVNVPSDENGYVFTFPQDISGSYVLIEGDFSIEETDVETLRHFAEDRGDSEEAIAAITEPQQTLILSATGARIQSNV